MGSSGQAIYNIIQELGLIQFLNDISPAQLEDIIDVNTNEVDGDRFEEIFCSLTNSDKLRIKAALRYNPDNQIEMRSDSDGKLSAMTIIENKPSQKNDININSNQNENENEKWKESLDAGSINVDRNAIGSSIVDNPTMKSNPNDITCVHHISYKAVAPNNFVPSYSKRYYIESTGEEVYNNATEDNLNNAGNTNAIGKISPVHPFNHEPCSTNNNTSQTSYNRNYYHPYQNIPMRSYTHNRINSEPARHHIPGFYLPNAFPPNPYLPPAMFKGNERKLSPNSAVSLHPIPSSQPDYNMGSDMKSNNFKIHPPQLPKITSFPNVCPVFEGYKAMENSPLHKYNLLDPPIFKYHSIRIPPRIPFLIRLDSLDEDRVNMIKNASIIFGKSDNRRKSSSLNLNEMLMNEVAFQLCLRDPLYLISRQKLIMESREIIRESGHRIQDDVNIIPFEESTSQMERKYSNEFSTAEINQPSLAASESIMMPPHVAHPNKNVTNSIKNLTISNDVKTISEVRDAPLIPYNKCDEADPFFIQDEPSSVQSRNLMAKYCYDDYDTIYYYKMHRKWPTNADSSRKAYLRRKSKKFKIIDNYLYSVSSFSERLRLWLRDVDAVVEHAPRFHLSNFVVLCLGNMIFIKEENGEHFTRNETISRMLRYCYSNDIAQGVTKFIQSCEVCAEKEWRNRGGSERTLPIGMRSHHSLVNHQLLSSATNVGDGTHSHVRNMTLNSAPVSDHLSNNDHYVYCSSDNSNGNIGSSSCIKDYDKDENSGQAEIHSVKHKNSKCTSVSAAAASNNIKSKKPAVLKHNKKSSEQNTSTNEPSA